MHGFVPTRAMIMCITGSFTVAKIEEPVRRHGLTHNVVAHLLSPIYNEGHVVIFMDKYFSSPIPALVGEGGDLKQLPDSLTNQ